MKRFTLLSMAMLLLFGVANAATQITTFGYPLGIASDTNEWTCSRNGQGNISQFRSALVYTGYDYIRGTSKSLPMTFEFFHYTSSNLASKDWALKALNEVLARYVIATSSVISNVSFKGDTPSHYTLSACFFDNKSSGYLVVHTMKDYVMFVELRSDLFDEATRESLMNKPFELITELYKPKQLAKIMGFNFEDFTDCIIIDE